MLASFNTHDYCNPKILAKNRVYMDRWDTERAAWNRAPEYLRKRGYQQGVDALLVYRKGEMVPVVLPELTALEIDKLLALPALTGRA
jgi:hypothetical protein